MGLLNNSNAIESGGYNIDCSLRFRSSASAYLNRTPASNGSATIFTWSGWVKRGSLSNSADQWLFSSTNYLTSGSSNPLTFEIVFKGTGSGADTDKFTVTAENNLSSPLVLYTSQVFRDTSAWYHLVVSVDTTQATASNRAKIYVNGSQVTSLSTATYCAQNTALGINQSGNTPTIGCMNLNGSGTRFFDGYLAEVNFIDGQALTPSSFGEFSTETGVWVPKKYTGTYGTNGFYLDFKTNTSATTLAYDKSGNGNNWTANNISTTAGATYDSMTDVPTLTSATAANFAVMNPIDRYHLGINSTLSNANLTSSYGANFGGSRASICFPSSGKWYAEVFMNSVSADITTVGIVYSNSIRVDYYSNNGNKDIGGAISAYGASYGTNDTIGIAVDCDAKTITYYKNGVSQGAISIAFDMTLTAFHVQNYNSTCSYNFGQRPFTYTPPTGFKSLNTFNLPDPVIKKPNQYMDVTLATGNNGTQTIVNAGGFQPDFVWMKVRDIADNHISYDSVRGVQNYLSSNLTSAEGTNSQGLTSFNSNGFTLGNINPNYTGSHTFVAWQWKKGATPGFDIVTYTGNDTARTIAHSLGVKPSLIVVKNRNSVLNWTVYHATLGATKRLFLNTTDASAASSIYWNNTEPTSSVFSVGTAPETNNGSTNLVAYLFAEIPGFSKFGSYTGNGSTDGPFVYCGFRPKYVMVKVTSSAGYWMVYDSARDTYNVVGNFVKPSAADAEVSAPPLLDFVSNGFKLRGINGVQNDSGQTYIYAAFAENPLKYSLAK